MDWIKTKHDGYSNIDTGYHTLDVLIIEWWE